MDKNKVRKAATWSAIDHLVRHGLNFVVLILLARVLSPADFGLIAMLAIFVGVAELLIDSGFAQALIQRQRTTPTDESTIFFFTLGMGALIAIALCVAAPWIAFFYAEPKLEQITYWMALNLFLNAFGTIHTTLLTKELNFKAITKAGMVSTLISASVAIYMATDGWGVWSLVGQILANTLTTVGMLWLLDSWRPRWTFSINSLKSLFQFGGYLLWTGLLGALYKNLYALLIGQLHTVQEVGYYSQALRLQQMPVTIMTSIVGRVAFPVFASVSEDKVRLARGMGRALASIMFINIPMMLGLMMLAEPAILVLFGEKWLPSVPILQALTLVGLMWPFNALNINILKAQGHSALNARIQLIRLTIAIALLLFTSPYGILAIAYGQVLASILALFVNTHYTKKLLGYGWFAQLRDIAPYMGASIPLVLVLWGVGELLKASALAQLIVAPIASSGVYLLVCKITRLGAYDELSNIFKRRSNSQ